MVLAWDCHTQSFIRSTLPRHSALRPSSPRQSNPSLYRRDFTKAHKSPAEASEAVVQWLLREWYRRSFASFLSDTTVTLLLSHDVMGLPSAVLKRNHVIQKPYGKGVAWKTLADPHIQWSMKQARKRLPTKAPESEAFRAEVRSWMKRALNERLEPNLLQQLQSVKPL